MTNKEWQRIYTDYFCNDFKQRVIWQEFSIYLQECSNDFSVFWDSQAGSIPSFDQRCMEAQDDYKKSQRTIFSKVCDFYIPVKTDCGPMLGCTPVPKWVENQLTAQQVVERFFNEEGNNPMNTINTSATANVTQKTDLQTQREYLLGRWKEVFHAFDYGLISKKMAEAFEIYTDNRPKTAKELFDGITSGKYTLDADEVPRQEVYTARYGRMDFDSIFDAVKWGGLEPDRAGWEKACEDFRDKLKLLKDQIMTGDPAASATALQALEAWTPPSAAVAN